LRMADADPADGGERAVRRNARRLQGGGTVRGLFNGSAVPDNPAFRTPARIRHETRKPTLETGRSA
jgi:hypothetical protein